MITERQKTLEINRKLLKNYQKMIKAFRKPIENHSQLT